ncbi:hypothetical protein AMATHDRAFT_56329 [Amanita thiersii Skay4041]|uniref:Uncharacterized protein n=1 Tax=Amanita thiersii Skay4041 TaxID=703135 RepID=A0A2A9NWS5_9AGAR|nr:hypothetical protein AMATHDRAFT_56329 [Amanita thiersii Skay4041]
MDLPSTRELELEALIRQRDSQLAQLTDEVSHLRQFLSSQPGPSTTDPITLPPPIVSLLLPRLSPSSLPLTGSGTVAAALTQRACLLQEENDELYEILKHGETGHLKQEVRGLRRVVERLEKALRESHQVIESLSTELEKSRASLMASARQSNSMISNKSASQSPRNSFHPGPRAPPTGNGNHPSKPLPTGPRTRKKPRLSEARAVSPGRAVVSEPHKNTGAREYPSRHPSDHRGKGHHPKMDVDDEHRRTPSPIRERDRDRDRERGPKDRDKDRDRDTRYSRRNGHFSGGSGRGGTGPSGRRMERNSMPAGGGDRTLAERLGL